MHLLSAEHFNLKSDHFFQIEHCGLSNKKNYLSIFFIDLSKWDRRKTLKQLGGLKYQIVTLGTFFSHERRLLHLI